MSYQHQILGTIIASVLEYDELCSAIGELHIATFKSNYVPCDGRSILESKLASTGISNAPDLRGRFLRGLNVMYNHGELPPLDLNSADPDGTDRRVGSYQEDKMKKHTHSIPTNDDGTPVSGGNYKTTAYSKSNGPSVSTGENENAGVETRPKNIAVYYYIKIN